MPFLLAQLSTCAPVASSHLGGGARCHQQSLSRVASPPPLPVSWLGSAQQSRLQHWGVLGLPLSAVDPPPASECCRNMSFATNPHPVTYVALPSASFGELQPAPWAVGTPLRWEGVQSRRGLLGQAVEACFPVPSSRLRAQCGPTGQAQASASC